MTLSKEEHNAVIDTMAANFGIQDEPKVGIFWYDTERDELFGVRNVIASELNFLPNGKKTAGILHKKLWQKE